MSSSGDSTNVQNSQLKTYAVALKKMKEKLEKYKTLTIQFKKTLENKTEALREKEKIVSVLRAEFKDSMEDAVSKRKVLQSELKRLRDKVDEYESKEDEYDNNDDDDGEKKKLPEPRFVLERVIEPSGPGEGRVWCLVGYKQNSSGWEQEDSLRERTRRDYGVELSMPPVAPNAEEIGQLQDEHQTLKDDLKKVKHEFRRYRVRAELSIRQKEAALTKNREELAKNFGNKIREIAGTDTAGDLKRARAEIEFMKRGISELKRKCKKAVETTEKKITENEDLRLDLEEANREKIEWQLRYENYVQEQRGRDLAEAVENAQLGKVAEYERLQKEFADYKRRVTLLVQEREYALQEARAKLSRSRNGTSCNSSSSGSNGSAEEFSAAATLTPDSTTKGQYVRNIVLQYMSTSDPDVRSKLEIAIGKMLSFSSVEMKSIRGARRGWFF
jgi:DNA repair exonuclease SbcCD ATPase subunit